MMNFCLKWQGDLPAEIRFRFTDFPPGKRRKNKDEMLVGNGEERKLDRKKYSLFPPRQE